MTGVQTCALRSSALDLKAPIDSAVLTGVTKGTVFVSRDFTTSNSGTAYEGTQTAIRAAPTVGVAGAGNEVIGMGVAGSPGVNYPGRWFWETIPAAQVVAGNALYKRSYAMNLRATDVSDNAVTPPIITLRGNGVVEVPGTLTVAGPATVPTAAAQANTLDVANTNWVNRRGLAYQPVQGIGLNTGSTAMLPTNLGHWFQFSANSPILSVGADVNAAAPFGATFTVRAPYAGVINFDGTGVVLPSAVYPVASYAMRAGEVATFTYNGPNGGWYVTSAGIQPAVLDITYAPIANPTFTGTVSGISKVMVGLGNADNTSDTNKPVSTAQATALGLKAPVDNPTLTDLVTINTTRTTKLSLRNAGVVRGGVGADGSFCLRVSNATDTAYVLDLDNSGVMALAGGLITAGLRPNADNTVKIGRAHV